MTIEEIRKNAPDGATHYEKVLKTIIYIKLENHFTYYWNMSNDFEYSWIVLACRSLMKPYIKDKLKPL